MTTNYNIFILPKVEIIVYFTVYLSFISYAIYHVYLVSNDLPRQSEFGFENGWKFLGRYKDNLGEEWENAQIYVYKNFVWYIGHITMTEIGRFLKIKEYHLVHSSIGLLFLISTYNFLTVFTILTQLSSFYLILIKFKRKSITWLLAFIWLAVMNFLKQGLSLYSHLNDDEFLQLILILAWNILKCLSFSLDAINYENTHQNSDCKNLREHYNWKTYSGYILYFPNLIFGPCLIFERYISTNQKQELESRLLQLMKDLARIVFWTLFYNFVLHYFYVHYLGYNINKIKNLNFWAFYGYGYLMGQFFHLQYTISYGLSNALGKFDGITTPSQPKCIARVHLYSDMWKYFDKGLYEFLFRYIYTACCKKTSSVLHKFMASLLTFIFIYVWHGLMKFILIWSILNFVCLCLEKLLRYFILNSTYLPKFFENHLGPKMHLRFYGLLASQLFILAAFSNFYFFANTEIGNYFFIRTFYLSDMWHYLIVTLWCYCIFQCSEFILCYEKTKSQKTKNKLQLTL